MAKALYYAAAGTTGIAGIIHLYLVPGSFGFSPNVGIFFLVSGLAQLFWVVPMVRRWGRIWYGVGIGGSGTLIAIWTITRLPENIITANAIPVNQNGIIVEVMQAAFIGLNMAILIYEKIRTWSAKTPTQNA